MGKKMGGDKPRPYALGRCSGEVYPRLPIQRLPRFARNDNKNKGAQRQKRRARRDISEGVHNDTRVIARLTLVSRSNLGGAVEDGN